MIKKIGFALVSAICIFSITSYAAPATSVIPLSAGSAAPYGDVEIKFNKLLESVSYRVSCDIVSNDKSKLNADYIQLFYSDNLAKISVNNNPITFSGQNTTIGTTAINQIIVENVITQTGDIAVRNLDNQDTITVKNCFATPTV